MRVLIIGGTGLISTPITRLLAQQGAEVSVFNRANHPESLPPGVRQIVGDRTDHPAFERQMGELGHFDCVIDMVCYQPAEALSLLRAFGGRVGQLMVCSTVDVYQKPPSAYPIAENTPRRPSPSSYPQNKAKLEAVLWQAADRGLPLTVLRPAHTYAQRGWLLSSLSPQPVYLERLRRGRPIVVHGDGSSLWCSCWAEDVAQAFVQAVGNPRALGRAYNLAGGEWMTWDQMHLAVAEALGVPLPELVPIPTNLLSVLAPKRAHLAAVNFRYNNLFDSGAAKADLGFVQTVGFAEGCRRTVAWLEAQGLLKQYQDDGLEDRVIAAWARGSQAMMDACSADPLI